MDPFGQALGDAGGVGAPRARAAQLRRLLAAELDRSARELAAARSGYPSPVTVVVAALAGPDPALLALLPVDPALRADPAAVSERAWLLTAATLGALAELGGSGTPLLGAAGGALALRLSLARGPADEPHVAPIARGALAHGAGSAASAPRASAAADPSAARSASAAADPSAARRASASAAADPSAARRASASAPADPSAAPRAPASPRHTAPRAPDPNAAPEPAATPDLAPGSAPAAAEGEAGELAELVALAFEEQVASVDRLRGRALAVPAHLLDHIGDLRPPPDPVHPVAVAAAIAALGGRPADPRSTDEHEEAVLARLQPVGAPGAIRPHEEPDPVRRVARRILQRLDGMGKWGGYHTEFAHLARGFAPADRALAAEVGERLLRVGLLDEKPSVGQRHVFLNPRRAGEIHAAIRDGALPAGLDDASR